MLDKKPTNRWTDLVVVWGVVIVPNSHPRCGLLIISNSEQHIVTDDTPWRHCDTKHTGEPNMVMTGVWRHRAKTVISSWHIPDGWWSSWPQSLRFIYFYFVFMTGDNYSGVCHMVIAGEGSNSLHWDDSTQHSGIIPGLLSIIPCYKLTTKIWYWYKRQESWQKCKLFLPLCFKTSRVCPPSQNNEVSLIKYWRNHSVETVVNVNEKPSMKCQISGTYLKRMKTFVSHTSEKNKKMYIIIPQRKGFLPQFELKSSFAFLMFPLWLSNAARMWLTAP